MLAIFILLSALVPPKSLAQPMDQIQNVDPAGLEVRVVDGFMLQNKIEFYQDGQLLLSKSLFGKLDKLEFLKQYFDTLIRGAVALGTDITITDLDERNDFREFYLHLLSVNVQVRSSETNMRMGNQYAIPVTKAQNPQFIETREEMVLLLDGHECLRLRADGSLRFSADQLNRAMQEGFSRSANTIIFLNLERYWNHSADVETPAYPMELEPIAPPEAMLLNY